MRPAQGGKNRNTQSRHFEAKSGKNGKKESGAPYSKGEREREPGAPFHSGKDRNIGSLGEVKPSCNLTKW